MSDKLIENSLIFKIGNALKNLVMILINFFNYPSEKNKRPCLKFLNFWKQTTQGSILINLFKTIEEKMVYIGLTKFLLIMLLTATMIFLILC